jgi:hypothetical protein
MRDLQLLQCRNHVRCRINQRAIKIEKNGFGMAVE